MLRVFLSFILFCCCFNPVLAFEAKGTDGLLTLENALSLVAAQNLTLLRAKEEVTIANSRYWQQKIRLLPSVGLEAEQQTYQLRNVTERRNAAARVVLSLSVPGNQAWVIQQRRYALSGVKANLEANVQGVLATLANRFYTALESDRLLDVSKMAVNDAEEQIVLSQNRPDDLSRAQGRKVQQQRRLTGSLNQYAQSLQNLRQVLNLPAETDLTLAAPLDDVKPSTLIASKTLLPDLLAVLRQTHPELLRLRAEVKALDAQLMQEKTDFLPELTGRAYWGGSGLGWPQQQEVHSAGLSVTATVLEHMGANIPLRVKEVAARTRQRQAELLDVERLLERDLVEAFLDSQAFLENLAQSTQEKQLAEENYQRALVRYKEGHLPFVSLIDAQDSLINARNTYWQTLFNYNRAQVSLLEAIGQVSPKTLLQGFLL
jgi:outer membrane protein TolC